MRKLLSWRLAPRSHRGQGHGHLIPPIVHGVMEGEAEPQKKDFGAARAPVLPAAADQRDASVTRREMRTRLLANWRELAEKIFNPGQQPGLAQRTHRLSAGRCKARQHRGKPSSPGGGLWCRRLHPAGWLQVRGVCQALATVNPRGFRAEPVSKNPLRAPPHPQAGGFLDQLLAEIRVGDVDQGLGPLPGGFGLELRTAEFGHHVMDQ